MNFLVLTIVYFVVKCKLNVRAYIPTVILISYWYYSLEFRSFLTFYGIQKLKKQNFSVQYTVT